jgi:hypothetical protein
MRKWAAIVLCLAVAGGCLGAMGVGSTALLRLLLSLAVMVCVALLIAWPFLRHRSPP